MQNPKRKAIVNLIIFAGDFISLISPARANRPNFIAGQDLSDVDAVQKKERTTFRLFWEGQNRLRTSTGVFRDCPQVPSSSVYRAYRYVKLS